MRKLGTICAEVDTTKILEDNDEFLVVPAILAREGVYPYSEGRAYKPAEELKAAAWTADGAWVVAENHPDTLILTDRREIKGRVENPRFDEDTKGIHANIRFYKSLNDPKFLEDVKTGRRKDVSLGFFYDFDPTYGEWNGRQYDFVQRNILVDHVAAGVPVGRCRSPYCGIAVDSFIRKVAADPWEETEDYIRSGHKEPGDTCRTIDISEDQGIKAIYCKYGDKWDIQSYLFSKAKKWTIEKAKAWFQEHQGDSATQLNEEGEREKAKSAQEARSRKYGIGIKEGGNVTKPGEFEDIPDDEFADPVNYRYPIDADHVMAAWAYISKPENKARGGYSEEEWTKMQEKVKAAMKKHGHEVTAGDAVKEIERSRRLLKL